MASAQEPDDDLPMDVATTFLSDAQSGIRMLNLYSSPESQRLSSLLRQIGKLYHRDGNYAAALDMLAGIDMPPYEDMLRPMFSVPETKSIRSLLENVQDKDVQNFFRYQLYSHLSIIYGDIGMAPTSLVSQLKAIDYLKKVTPLKGDLLMQARYHLGLRYFASAMNDSAAVVIKTLEQDIAAHKDSSVYPGLLYLKALAAIQNEQKALAIQLLERDFTFIKKKKIKWPEFYNMALALGNTYMHTKAYEKADSVFTRNVNVLKNNEYQSVIFGEMYESYNENLIYMKQYEKAAQNLILLGHWMFEQTQNSAEGLTEFEESSFAIRTDRLFDLFYTIMIKAPGLPRSIMGNVVALELQRKNQEYLTRAFLRKQTRMYWDNATPLPFSQLRRIKQTIADQYTLAPADRTLNTDSLREQSDGYERKIAWKGFALAFSQQMKFMISDIYSTLETKIEFVRFKFLQPNAREDTIYYGAIVFQYSPDYGDFVRLCKEEDLLKILGSDASADNNQLTRKIYDKGGSGSIPLYKMIWEPLLAFLGNTKEINISAAGVLNNISFNALYNGSQHLLNVYRLHSFASLLDIGETNRTKLSKPSAINVWGNIDYNNAVYKNTFSALDARDPLYFSLLPAFCNRLDTINVWKDSLRYSFKKNIQASGLSDTGSPDTLSNLETIELNNLQKISAQSNIPFTFYTAKKATEESFKEYAPNAKGVIHLFTHGYYTGFKKSNEQSRFPAAFISGIDNPLNRCWLAFSGANYYWENGAPYKNHDDGILTGAEVEMLDLHKVDLAILNACETGLGDLSSYEGNAGLQRAFRMAGVRKLIVSLWQVPAKQSSELLTLFYNYWLAGKKPEAALTAAQQSLEKDGVPAFYWAGMVFID